MQRCSRDPFFKCFPFVKGALERCRDAARTLLSNKPCAYCHQLFPNRYVGVIQWRSPTRCLKSQRTLILG